MTEPALPDALIAALPDDAEIELNVALDTLKRHPNNPRKGDRDKIRKSIELHGFADVVIAQRSTRFIIAGWHRQDVARELGYTVAPIVIWRDVDDEEAKRQVLSYNKASDDATYDLVALRDVLLDLDATTAGLDATLFTDDDLLDLRRVTGDLSKEQGAFLDGLAPPPDARIDHRGGIEGQGLDRALTMQFTFPTLDQRDTVVRALNLARKDRGDTLALALHEIAVDWLATHPSAATGTDDPKV